MAATSDYLALDLGAESGRGVLGRFDGRHLTLEEVHRFSNRPVKLANTLHWDFPSLFEEIKVALRRAKAEGAKLDAIAVDTWGVDFGLVGRGDTLLGNPVHYRDARTEGMQEAAFALIPRERIYEITGLQFLQFNTAYQILAMVRANSPLLEVAETFLMVPDLFGWLLTGRRACERTDATTTQLFDPNAGAWSDEIFSALGAPRGIFPEVVEPGTELAPLLSSVAQEVGLPQVPVIAPATHDTASAVAAVPARSVGNPDWCYISSGTWSLMGVEVPRPIINERTLRYNFTNEGGIAGTTRFLKNIMGLWLVQECRRSWAKDGRDYSYEELVNRAFSADAFRSLVDPDDPSFFAPGDMPARIAAFCERTGQPIPEEDGDFVRCALESLALKYRWALGKMESITGTKVKTIHIVGGGSRNELLCQFTADACGLPVLAGPVEATAIGNVLVQAMARGRLGGVTDLRAVVARSFPVTTYEPRAAAAWDEAAGRFAGLLGGVAAGGA